MFERCSNRVLLNRDQFTFSKPRYDSFYKILYVLHARKQSCEHLKCLAQHVNMEIALTHTLDCQVAQCRCI